MKTYRCVSVMAALLLVVTASVACADLITPSGLQPGDEFRFVFVTSTGIDPSSAWYGAGGYIENYDAFVSQSATAAGLTTYGGSDVSWMALASASITGKNANERIGTDSPALYLVSGDKVADGGLDLWDGTIDHAINVTELGTTYNGNVWTGTHYNGVGIHRLGGTYVQYGLSTDVDGDWMFYAYTGALGPLPIYAVSSVVTAVPEPASIWLMLCGGLAGLLWWKRRK